MCFFMLFMHPTACCLSLIIKHIPCPIYHTCLCGGMGIVPMTIGTCFNTGSPTLSRSKCKIIYGYIPCIPVSKYCPTFLHFSAPSFMHTGIYMKIGSSLYLLWILLLCKKFRSLFLLRFDPI